MATEIIGQTCYARRGNTRPRRGIAALHVVEPSFEASESKEELDTFDEVWRGKTPLVAGGGLGTELPDWLAHVSLRGCMGISFSP